MTKLDEMQRELSNIETQIQELTKARSELNKDIKAFQDNKALRVFEGCNLHKGDMLVCVAKDSESFVPVKLFLITGIDIEKSYISLVTGSYNVSAVSDYYFRSIKAELSFMSLEDLLNNYHVYSVTEEFFTHIVFELSTCQITDEMFDDFNTYVKTNANRTLS